MLTYGFYRMDYMGSSIPESEFAAVAARANAQLALYKRRYRVTAPTEDAENMALCAMADALYYFDTAASGGIATSVSVGSVSTSMAQSTLPDLSPKAQAAELYRCAKLYLDIERWCGPC